MLPWGAPRQLIQEGSYLINGLISWWIHNLVALSGGVKARRWEAGSWSVPLGLVSYPVSPTLRFYFLSTLMWVSPLLSASCLPWPCCPVSLLSQWSKYMCDMAALSTICSCCHSVHVTEQTWTTSSETWAQINPSAFELFLSCMVTEMRRSWYTSHLASIEKSQKFYMF